MSSHHGHGQAIVSAAQPGVSVLAVYGPIARADLPGLFARVCGRLASTDADVVLLDVATVVADAVTVDALARLQLGARRHGRRVRLRNATPELRELVRFMGLDDVLPD